MDNDAEIIPEEELVDIGGEQAIDVIQNTLDSLLEAASVDAVYGDPVEHGDTLVIPSAEILGVMGFGLGTGYGSNAGEGEAGEANEGGGSGGGGGGRVLSRPVAVIISTPGGVRVEPVIDVTKIALAALTAGGFMLGMLARMSRPRRSLS